MIIIIEDYKGNEICKIDINTFKDLCEIENLTGCNILEVDKNDRGEEYLKLKLNKTILIN